ncbi:MAG TPA: hypothetical protein VIJ53_02980 [Acidobacteriaceae bacterium]
MDPPEAAIVRLLPLLPVMLIPVALVAVTVKTEELPLTIDVGLAVIAMVGAGEPVDWPLNPPANAGTAPGRNIKRT